MTLPERWFRTRPDSSVLDRPRLLARSLIDAAALDDRIGRYERLLGARADLRMPIPDFGGLELAAVGGLLLIASERPFTPMQRRTAYSLIVPSLAGALRLVRANGGIVLEPREAIVPGARARVRFADGAIAELVEHRPRPGERPRPPGGPAPRPTGVRLMARLVTPSAAFERSVALYEAMLGTPAEARTRHPSPIASDLAVVGELLIIGSDGLAAEGAPAAAFALLAEPGAAAFDPGEHGRAERRLETGALAEIWTDPARGSRRPVSPHPNLRAT
ncbi:lactoylglutathione lyase [Actinomadura litoris]|uniref:Lactoylglutathione lyase n=1 Tax=Actinomadura litoris TaxID=2678616 RepID=A0A7K1KUU3_9ACTN|nr:lactoylglutathione lyase [Actinomadura litoris]MUN35716.1 lactoylglutathione lyase [Actinomadura litoris]